jgi:hypothetical protein
MYGIVMPGVTGGKNWVWVRECHVGSESFGRRCDCTSVLLWIATRASARLRRVKHRTHTYAFSINNSGSSSLPPFTITRNTLRTAIPLAGLLVQPSANADPPSGWLVLSALVGLPIALWAYKVRLVEQFRDCHIDH